MKILGVETSCDDTGIAIYDSRYHTVEHLLYSQTKLHEEFGGIVPELASRDHIRKIMPLLTQLLRQTQIDLKNLDGFAYTKGPGLMGSLLVGTTFTKSLAWALDKPSIGINHLEAHFMAAMLLENPPKFPFLGLLVSGGHTLLVNAISISRYHILGQTLDDAVGECFDKTAKLLKLGYPGGPVIANFAKLGEKGRFNLPKPMAKHDNLNFSFSGLKTSVRNLYGKLSINNQDIKDICCALESTIVEVISIKVRKAILQTGMKNFVLAGGVAANVSLRKALANICSDLGVDFFCPLQKYCTDNGAMVAITGYRYLRDNVVDQELGIKVNPRWPLDELRMSN